MNSNDKKFNEMKLKYKEHQMSERQVIQMKEKINQAKKENRRKEKTHLYKNIGATAAVAAAIITILPNTSPAIAYAMNQIPILSKWVTVVTFRDYQYSDDQNSANINVPEIALSTDTTDNTAENNSIVSEQMKKTTDEINLEIQTITNQLIKEFEENKQNEDGYQNMTVTSELLATTDQYFTLKLICFQSAGSGAEWDYYYTIDLSSGKRLQLTDLFNENSNYIDIISENIKEQMKSQMAVDENISYWIDSDVPEWDFQSITDETSFYLNENNDIVICFNEGDVAPMYMGCVEFVIPNDLLSSIRK